MPSYVDTTLVVEGQLVAATWQFAATVWVKDPGVAQERYAGLNEVQVDLIEVKALMPDVLRDSKKTGSLGVVAFDDVYPSTTYKIEAEHLASGHRVGRQIVCNEDGTYTEGNQYTVD